MVPLDAAYPASLADVPSHCLLLWVVDLLGVALPGVILVIVSD